MKKKSEGELPMYQTDLKKLKENRVDKNVFKKIQP